MKKREEGESNSLLFPFSRISHRHTPKLNTSLFEVIFFCRNTPGADQRTGMVQFFSEKKHKTEEKKEMSEDEGLTMYFFVKIHQIK